ncbi:MAG: hypothetical protein R3280_06885 [Marinobacter sp.]|uniref:hypothetical protein n=1 Tax=Marinobacter sp. TaxID=50741 RepID=UPI00299DD5A1|nr:hypothetical protein [Marinobacter sp.]MDX1634341.1 hypothetical protein [Marinobacter sp.]
MAFWYSVLIHAGASALAVLLVLAGFHRWVLRPYLDSKVREMQNAADDIEPRVIRGVRTGMTEAMREMPETAVRDSTRQFLKFGSELFENGLSSFLGTGEEIQRRHRQNPPDSADPGHRR